jgi:hypothetical protein
VRRDLRVCVLSLLLYDAPLANAAAPSAWSFEALSALYFLCAFVQASPHFPLFLYRAVPSSTFLSNCASFLHERRIVSSVGAAAAAIYTATTWPTSVDG